MTFFRLSSLLVFEYPLSLANFLLNLAGDFFDSPFVFEIFLIAKYSGSFLQFAFLFENLAFNLVLGGIFHGIGPLS